MPKVHSHYENLKVARDAPPEVIRAAYRTLSQKYHPDKNSADPHAARIMALLNLAYDTLSDPIKRRQHDVWLAMIEGIDPVEKTSPRQSSNVDKSDLKNKDASIERFAGVVRHLTGWWGAYAILAIVIIIANIEDKKPQQGSTKSSPAAIPSDRPQFVAVEPDPPKLIVVERPKYVARLAPRPAYVRPETADNGSPWPGTSTYIKGYPRRFTDGYSTITIDNTQNDSDVFVKLYSRDSEPSRPVRVVFIRASDSFTLQKVRAGSYDVRYRDLDSGALARSDAFDIEEHRTDAGVRFSRFTMTLYKVRDGNMRMHDIAESEF